MPSETFLQYNYQHVRKISRKTYYFFTSESFTDVLIIWILKLFYFMRNILHEHYTFIYYIFIKYIRLLAIFNFGLNKIWIIFMILFGDSFSFEF